MKDTYNTLKSFYSFYVQSKTVFALFVISVLLYSVLLSVSPFFLRGIVDMVSNGDYEQLFPLLTVYFGVTLASVLFRNFAYYFGDKNMVDMRIAIQIEAVEHIQDLDFAYHVNKSSGKLISRINRGINSSWAFYQTLHFKFIGLFITFAIMVYAFRDLNSSVALVVLISLVMTMVVARLIIKNNLNKRRLVNKQDDKVSGVVVDNLVNFETVKYFSRENWERARTIKVLMDWKKAIWKFLMSFRVFDSSVGLIVSVSGFAVMLVTLKLAVSGSLTVGDFVLVITFLTIFYQQASDLVWSLRDIAEKKVDLEKLYSILDEPIMIKDPIEPVKLTSINGEVEFNKVSFTYDEGKKNAVRNIKLKVRQGQSIALVGRSGSGKTTLMKLLMRFYDVGKGEITIDGINIKDFTKSNLRSFMGVVPQEPIMFNNTIGYNIGYGKENAEKKEIEAAAKLANIHKFIETLPKKYKTNVGERGIKLSGGQKQRVAIARMILSDPDIIIFDEATSQLDSENEKLIQDAFWKVSENKTTIVIAHRLSTAARADKIIVMEEGKIVETGSHKSLLRKKDSLYKYFWDLQVDVD